MNYPNSMTLARQIRNNIQKIIRLWKNRTFRKEIALEKKKRYLFDAQKETKAPPTLFTLFREKKRFYYFNTFINTFKEHRNHFRTSFLFISSFLVIGSCYVLFFSPYFRISPSKVIIERLDSITDINIAYRSIEDVYGASIFSIETNTIIEKLTNLQKNIKHAEISRLFPNGLKIIIQSYKPEFFVRFPTSEKSYILTENGILVYQKTNESNLYSLDLVDPNFTEMSFIDYKEGVSVEFMAFILRARDFFKSTFANMNISKFTYFKSEREIHVALES
jgi:hypothetical protein